MSELKSGELCYAGQGKVKRIWLGVLNGKHFCVDKDWEEAFSRGADYMAQTWSICIPIPEEPEYEYQWMICGELVVDLAFYTEVEMYYAQDRYTKIERTKRLRK